MPATTNPLGVKGAGEGGTIGSLAAIVNAIVDAIPDGRGHTLDMPLTTEKIWRACHGWRPEVLGTERTAFRKPRRRRAGSHSAALDSLRGLAPQALTGNDAALEAE